MLWPYEKYLNCSLQSYLMNKFLVLTVLLLSSVCFSQIAYAPKDTPMTCLKACCANACGNGQWDTDGGFCHGPYVETSACVSCQEACREDVGKTGTEPYSSTYPSTSSSSPDSSSPDSSIYYPTSSGSNSNGSAGSAGLCGLPAALMGLVCGLMVLRKAKK